MASPCKEELLSHINAGTAIEGGDMHSWQPGVKRHNLENTILGQPGIDVFSVLPYTVCSGQVQK